jgi:hypothetical protein
MSKCKHKHGLLTLRECGRETSTRCTSCGKPICDAHCVDYLGRLVCHDCKAGPLGDGSGGDAQTRQAFRRNDYYEAVGYVPFFSRRYADADYNDGDYQDIDYDTFDDQGPGLAYDDFWDDLNADDFADS